jgi:hypothetical protein
MNPTLVSLAEQLSSFLAVGIFLALVLPRVVLRAIFVLATRGLAPAFLVLLLFDPSTGAAAVVFYAAMLGALFMTLALLALSFRADPFVGTGPSTRLDVVWYVLSSVLWFALLYWTGSRSDLSVLSFEVAQRFAPLATAPLPASALAHCVASAPDVLCFDRATPLDAWTALQLSAGNMLTLGAAGVTPLDLFTRIVMSFQLVPLFASAFVLSRD